MQQASKIRYIALGVICSGLMACSATYRNHGYVPSDDQLANLVVGVDTQSTVGDIVGRPTSTGVLENGGWYYISSRVRNYAYRKPQVITRELLAMSFDDKGVLSNIERFSLADGRVVTLSRRVTDNNVKGPGFFSQILGNFGNFNVGDFTQ